MGGLLGGAEGYVAPPLKFFFFFFLGGGGPDPLFLSIWTRWKEVVVHGNGSFRSYFLSIRSFRPGSFRSDFRGVSFRPSFGGSFRPTLFYTFCRY